MRVVRRLLFAATFLVLMAGAGHADPSKGIRITLFSGNATGVSPLGGGTSIFPVYGHTIGLGGEWHNTLGDGDVGYFVNGAFSIGNAKQTDTFGNTFEERLSSFRIGFGIDWIGQAGPVTLAYGPMAQFSSTKLTLDDGTNEAEGEPFTTFSLGARLALGGRATENVEVFGEIASLVGRGTADDGAAEFSEIELHSEYRIGIGYLFD